MSIMIKGMDVPKSCEDCRFYGIEVEGGCAVVKLFVIRRKAQTKPDWRPLEEAEPIHRNPEDAYREDFGKENDHETD